MKTNSKIQEIVDFFELEEGWSKDEIISQVISEIKELKGYEADEITLLWDDEELMVLIDFAEQFFNKIMQNTCNVIKSFMDD
jgi:hypothetical protein